MRQKRFYRSTTVEQTNPVPPTTPSHEHGSLRVVQTLCITIAIFGIAGRCSVLLIRGAYAPTTEITNRRDPTSKESEEAAFDLINPHHGDNDTDAAQNTTIECTQDFTLPVMAGVDLVAYFELHEGDPPIFGSENLISILDGYQFQFSTLENLWKFEEVVRLTGRLMKRRVAPPLLINGMNDPETYIPAWGGFCSYGIANEEFWTKDTLGPFANPTKWRILEDGKLHFFRSQVPMEKFGEDVDANVARGYSRWLRWFGVEHGPLNTACFCQTSVCQDD